MLVSLFDIGCGTKRRIVLSNIRGGGRQPFWDIHFDERNVHSWRSSCWGRGFRLLMIGREVWLEVEEVVEMFHLWKGVMLSTFLYNIGFTVSPCHVCSFSVDSFSRHYIEVLYLDLYWISSSNQKLATKFVELFVPLGRSSKYCSALPGMTMIGGEVTSDLPQWQDDAQSQAFICLEGLQCRENMENQQRKTHSHRFMCVAVSGKLEVSYVFSCQWCSFVSRCQH